MECTKCHQDKPLEAFGTRRAASGNVNIKSDANLDELRRLVAWLEQQERP